MPSSTIRDHRYDPATQTLSIWFVTTGRRYDYYDVPPDIAGAFGMALSKGRYFNQNIRDTYKSQWIAWDAAAPATQPIEKRDDNVVPFVRPRRP